MAPLAVLSRKPVVSNAPVLSKAPMRSRSVRVKAFRITVNDPNSGQTHTFDCDEDQYVLDAAEETGLDLPYSCRSGSCSTCIGKLEAGELDQSDQTCLDADQISQGWALICTAYPKSDCTILSHQEENFMMS